MRPMIQGRDGSHRSGRSLAFALVVVGCGALAAAAQGPTFVPGGDMDLWVGGKVDPAARIYESASEAAVLVVSDRLPTPVVLFVRSGGVQAVPKTRLVESGGGLNLQRGDALQDLGKFEVVATDVNFKHGDVVAVLRPKPSLVGSHTLDELYQHTPKYKVDAAAYTPDPDVIAKLRGVSADYHVKFVFGSWCSVCKHYLPRGLAVASALAGAPLKFEYWGLPLEDPWNSPEVKKLGVTSLPTAIVYRGTQEIGRFAGAPEFDHPEARLWSAIEKDTRPAARKP